MSDNRAFDLLGVKGLSDSVKITTQGFIDGAAAFLSRLCLPAAEEFGLALRDRISAWRARNAVRMLNKANKTYLSSDPNPADALSPRLVHLAIEEASWIDDEQIQDMWAGLLASATSKEGRSDENLIFMSLLKQLSSLEVKILRIAVEHARKRVSSHDLIVPDRMIVPTNKLRDLFGVQDLQRIDRELDHLRELGLIGWSWGGGIDVRGGFTDLTPSPLAMHLYIRAQGSRLSPATYWDLPPSKAEDVLDVTMSSG